MHNTEICQNLVQTSSKQYVTKKIKLNSSEIPIGMKTRAKTLHVYLSCKDKDKTSFIGMLIWIYSKF